MSPGFLHTDRLILRELTPDDVDRLFEVLGDPWTMRFYGRAFAREEVAAWIERWRTSYRENGFGLWGLELRDSGALVGDTGLTLQEVEPGETLVEVGWHVHKDHQRQGLATEAARASLSYGFDTLGLERIISLIRPENEPSWRVAEKLGMRIWKEVDRAHFPHRVYLLDRVEWTSRDEGSAMRSGEPRATHPAGGSGPDQVHAPGVPPSR